MFGALDREARGHSEWPFMAGEKRRKRKKEKKESTTLCHRNEDEQKDWRRKLVTAERGTLQQVTQLLSMAGF